MFKKKLIPFQLSTSKAEQWQSGSSDQVNKSAEESEEHSDATPTGSAAASPAVALWRRQSNRYRGLINGIRQPPHVPLQVTSENKGRG